MAGRKPSPRGRRKQNSICAYPEEIELIRRFNQIIRDDFNLATNLITQAEAQIKAEKLAAYKKTLDMN